MARRVNNRKKPWSERFEVTRDLGPRMLLFVGLFCLLYGLLYFPQSLKNYNRDNELRASGSVVAAEVDSVRKEHHSGRRSSWDEYFPTVKAEIDGRDFTVELNEYSAKRPGVYSVGQKLELMYEPGNPYYLPGIGDSFARKSIVRSLVGSSITGGVGGAMVLIGLPIETVRFVRRRRDKHAAAG